MSDIFFGLSEATLLVEFNASVWTARKLDKGTTSEVVAAKGAKARGAARVNKSLMAGRDELPAIQAVVGAARTYMHKHTVPWSDSGQRWLPTTKLLELDKKMAEFRDEYWARVEEFIAVYPSLITAQAMALGDMFDRKEFPPVEEIRNKFAFAYEFIPLPTTQDFRVDIDAEAAQDLRARLEESSKKRVDNAMNHVRKELKAHLERMVDRLSPITWSGGQPANPPLHSTVIGNAHELCDLISSFGGAAGEDMRWVQERLTAMLDGVTIERLRSDVAKREDVLIAANTLLNAWEF